MDAKLLVLFLTTALIVTLVDSSKLVFNPARAVIAQSNAKFDMDLFSNVAKPKENLIMSSFSVSSVLSMLLLGAGGNTAVELKQGLGLTEENDYTLYKEGFKDVMNLLNPTINTANRVYIAKEMPLNQSYISSAQKYFMASPQGLDFCRAEEASQVINRWVEDQTSNKIKNLIQPDMLDNKTAMVLVNAIYFKGTWKHKFAERHTRERDFYVTPNDIVRVDMMCQQMDNNHDYA